MENSRRNLIIISIAAVAASLMFVSGCFLAGDILAAPAPAAETGSDGAIPSGEVENKAYGSAVSIAEKASPAVVKVNTTRVQTNFPFYNDPVQQKGIGSGFIISQDGLVVTNQHVIDGASDITVTVGNKKENQQEYPVKVIGSSYDLDLALLKIKDAPELPYLKLGNSSNVKVGSRVVAIGNPFGFDHTVTTGVISAKGRPITVKDRHYKNLLQTDAAINPGNSGGPLLNMQGEVIGMNTAVADAQGIGFAIPSNTIRDALDQLKKGGQQSSAQAWLGIQMTDLPRELAGYIGLDSARGVVVLGVVKGSPADEAGLQPKDIILKFKGKRLEGAEDLAAAVEKMKPGARGELTIYRDGRIMEKEFAAGKKPARFR